MFAAELPDHWADLVRKQGENPEHATLQAAWAAFKTLATADLEDDYEHEHLEVYFKAVVGGTYTTGVPAGEEATEVGLIRHVAIPEDEDYTAMFAFSIVAYFDTVARVGAGFFADAYPGSVPGWFRGPGAPEQMFRAVEESEGFRQLLTAGAALSMFADQGDIE